MEPIRQKPGVVPAIQLPGGATYGDKATPLPVTAAEYETWQVRDVATPGERAVDAKRDCHTAALAVAVREAKTTILAKHADGGWLSGTIECPACGCALPWFMSLKNHNTRAACGTARCVNWAE